MSGYTPDEKLRLQQLRALRRQWLKDQELSPREPVLPPPKLGPLGRFWQRFLQPGGFWRIKTYNLCTGIAGYAFNLVFPMWIVYYYLKYHLEPSPGLIVDQKHRIFPGDRILETGEIMPPMEEEPTDHD
uniref:NADH dehydrogenase [ubiquinone] 1 beta subcomplex subunit 6 n=1 Tax=Pelusios castaneus TaxID=367368 RepID=A0A8C8RGK0_9SAUR